jgi:hypothetical protein
MTDGAFLCPMSKTDDYATLDHAALIDRRRRVRDKTASTDRASSRAPVRDAIVELNY